ncbi:MAG TPA: hypothetical protein VIZ66_08925 [Sphingomicrobium sp.]|jgi:hypothetical protein
MIARVALGLAAAVLATAGAHAQATDSDAPSADAKALIDACNAHRFETIVETEVDGQPRKQKVKLCGKPGQNDADWLATLKDAVDKVAANDQMSASAKGQVITALNTEIRRLSDPLRQNGASGFVLGKPTPVPRPATPAPEYAALPPMPPPKPAVTVPASAASLPMLGKPRFSMLCRNPGDLAGDGPCTEFVRDTMVTIRAGEDLPAGTSIRFLRGDATADIALNGLKRGKSLRVALPRAVCSGVGGGRLEVQTVRSGPGVRTIEQVVDSDGPFNLRC